MAKLDITSREGKRRPISRKIISGLIAILVPSLFLLITVSCLMAANSISNLNDKVLQAQTENAVSIVDGFFSDKLTAVSMYRENDELRRFFTAVSTQEQIDQYTRLNVIKDDLSAALEVMSGQNVQQVWLTSLELDTYLLSTGELAEANLAAAEWASTVMNEKRSVITDPFLDPASGEQVISIVTPVLSADGSKVLGMMGMDVFMSGLAQILSEIQIGQEGYMELLSGTSEYIYSEDPTVIGKNVESIAISDDYKNKVKSRYEGIMDFDYEGTRYTALSRKSSVTGWLSIATLPMGEVNATRNQLILALAGLSAVILVILIAVIVAVIHKTVRPLTDISRDLEQFANGHLDVDVQVHTNDEIGSLADSVRLAVTNLKEIINDMSRILAEIADGNLDVSVEGDYVGDFAPIHNALENIIQSLNNTLGQISQSSEQVASGANQVSSGAQALSQGAAEQASSIEELAATINDISGQVESNALSAEQANQKAAAVGDEAGESNQRMQDMLTAMANISNASGEIGKIIKTIEDIAFQTNILALNAAVEAARAGEAGKGFAVVADEVRNLASKSAEASRNTALLIESSLKAVEDGTKIADATAQSLSAVVSGVSEVTESIEMITAASKQQSDSIRQVTQGIDQVSSVVQTNSATAEESAAASEELSGQSQLLKEMVGKFKLSDIDQKKLV